MADTKQAKKIKAVIFDADGMVILGERPSLRLMRDFGVPKEKLDKFFDNEFRECIVGKADLKEKVRPYLKEWGWNRSEEDFFNFWFAESYYVDQRVLSLIKELRKREIFCILATSQEKYRVSFMKNEMGLGKVFDFIVATSLVGFRKNSNDFFEEIMKLIPGVERNEVVFWDDREKNVELGKDFGFQSVLYTNFDDFKKYFF